MTTTATYAFEDALIALEELGRGDVAARLRARWQDVKLDEFVGGVGNLRAIAGARVASVDVVSDAEVVLHTSGGAYRIRAEQEGRYKVDEVRPTCLLVEKRGVRP